LTWGLPDNLSPPFLSKNVFEIRMPPHWRVALPYSEYGKPTLLDGKSYKNKINFLVVMYLYEGILK